MIVANVVGLSGSLRAASINMALLRELSEYVPSHVSFEIVPLGGLPLFNPDLETDLPATIAAFRLRIRAADAFVIASPEYAHGISGVLKNALEWLVADTGLLGKPILVLNAAPRAHHADDALREILATMSANVANCPAPVRAGIVGFLRTLAPSEPALVHE